MKIYTVNQITEADFGCEETGRTEPTALLQLVSGEEEKYLEVTESKLEREGISEGKKVVFSSDGELLKYVRVVAAVIHSQVDGEEKVFATARGYGEYQGWWEFPGGKIEEGERPEEALVREIREELTAKIEVGELIRTVEYDYPSFHLSMDCFLAEVAEGELVLKEAEAAKWLGLGELGEVNWLSADLELIDEIRNIAF
ncbi:MAG: (deoxy)nucleoside triphosphate pyrophosphohydrolase [Eubacterium sp.]|nr:(deoxy)nucleoside triphosphate pyrophosphohydrolase [Eubacterium sp.]